MSPIDFEHLVQRLFAAMGFDSWDTRLTRDDGVDAIVNVRDPILGGLYLIQAKRYKHPVPAETVRAMVASVHDMNAVKGVIVTTSGFGEAGREFAKRAGHVELIDGRRLSALLQKHLGLDAHHGLSDFPKRESR